LQAAQAASTTGGIFSSGLGVIDNRQATESTTITSSRFLEVRVQSIEVWGLDINSGTTVQTGENGISLRIFQSENNELGGDGAVFRDFGTNGSRRPHIKVIPNLALREQWLNTNVTATEGKEAFAAVQTAFGTDFGDTTPAGVILRFVVQFR
jgi:hypothetical protein